MKQISLPNTVLTVSQFAFGTTGYDGTFPTADGFRLMAKYFENGGNFIDTAHCYSVWVEGGEGTSERFVGAAVREFGRDKFVIATKGGHTALSTYPRPAAFMGPEIIRRDLEESLDRLGLSSVDIYYLHRDDPRMSVAEIIESLNEHVKSGKVRYLGASNWSVARYLEANEYAAAKGLHPFVILQNQWSLAQPNWTDLISPGAMRYIEEAELSTLREHQIPVVAYTPTASGYFATNGERGSQNENPQNRKRLVAAQALAEKKGASPNLIALAYLLNQPLPVIAVLGTRNEEHLIDSLESAKIDLTAEDLKLLVA